MSPSQSSGGARCADEHWRKRSFIISRNFTVKRGGEAGRWLEVQGDLSLQKRPERVCGWMGVTQQRGLCTGRRGAAAGVGEAHDGAGVGFGKSASAAPFYVLSIRATDPWVGVGAPWWAPRGFDRQGGGDTEGVLSAHLLPVVTGMWSSMPCPLPSRCLGAGVEQEVWVLLALCFARSAVTGPGEQGLRARPGPGTEDTCLECCFCL